MSDLLTGIRGSLPHMIFILVVTGFYAFQLITFALSLPQLFEMYRFYTHLLGVPDVRTGRYLEMTLG